MIALPRWLRKFFARIGCPTLGFPTDDYSEGEKKKDDFGLMVFHYCRQCREYHWDHVIDWLSKSEHFLCGNCGATYKSDQIFGLSFFYISECLRVAKENKKSSFLYLLFGFKKYYPPDREGKTAAYLEAMGADTFLDCFSHYPPNK